MPEVWLPYGLVEVPIDIRAENLAEVLEPVYPSLKPQSLSEQMAEVGFEGRTLLLVCDTGPPIIEVVKSLLEEASKKGLKPDDITLMAPKGYHGSLRRVSDDHRVRVIPIGPPSLNVGVADGVAVKVPTEFAEYQTKLIVSEVGFDPLFGFKGGPVSLLKCINDVLMKEAFLRRSGDSPKPGEDTNAAWFASRVAEEVGDLLSVEILPSGDMVSAVFTGRVGDAHTKASASLIESAKKTLSEPARAIITSPGGIKHDSYLASSLKALINLTAGLKEKGGVALLAECSEGLGSEALQLFVSGRLNLTEAVKRREYVKGLEDLLYLNRILQEQTVILVSSLPNYYVESRLGLRAVGKSSDALTYLLSNLGPRIKVHIVPRAAETLLSAKSEKGS